VKGNVALIGDASGSVDAVTGEGLAIGFRQARLLSRSLEMSSLNLYAAEHDRMLRMPRRMARGLLMADKYAWMRNAAMRVLARSPELCHGLLQVHMGEESLPHLMLHRGADIVKGIALSGLSASDTERAST
jgi:menaquinone-9 beta-reductase